MSVNDRQFMGTSAGAGVVGKGTWSRPKGGKAGKVGGRHRAQSMKITKVLKGTDQHD